jgi:DNA adenine methylase
MPVRSKKRLVSPVLWLGGKGLNWQWVVKHFPEHRIYVEPFGGGASVLLNKPAVEVEVYNDLDRRLYHIFATLRDNKKAGLLLRQLRLTPYHEHEYSLAWSGKLSKDPVERARMLFCQLRMAFGGLAARGKRPGFGFAKSGSRATTTVNAIEGLVDVIERLRNVNVMCRCGIDVIKRFDTEETLHYCDPPYVAGSRVDDSPAYIHEFEDNDHLLLATALNEAKGRVVISGYPSDLYDRLYRGWRVATREQALTCSRKKGDRRTEVLWMNFDERGKRLKRRK